VNIPRQGIGHAIGVLFKAFFLFISVIITFALVTALIGLIFTGAGVLPLKNYFIQGFWQNIMVWSVLLFFLVLPVVGLLTWLIRRIIGARRGGNYLGYTFGSLWVIGLISLIFLAASISRNFATRNGVDQEIPLTEPAQGKLIVKVNDSKPFLAESDWMGIDWHHRGPFFDVSDDSLTINTVRVNVIKSDDSAWHLQLQKLSRGRTTAAAGRVAEEINFPVEQRDSVLLLARGFAITPSQQFRNQQVLIVIKVPVGKRIYLNRNLDDYRWFNINRRWRNNGIDIEFDDDSDRGSDTWDSGVEYIMTEHGLERTGKSSQWDNEDNPDKPQRTDSTQNKKDDYRYHKPKTAAAVNVPDHSGTIENKDPESSAILVLLSNLS